MLQWMLSVASDSQFRNFVKIRRIYDVITISDVTWNSDVTTTQDTELLANRSMERENLEIDETVRELKREPDDTTWRTWVTPLSEYNGPAHLLNGPSAWNDVTYAKDPLYGYRPILPKKPRTPNKEEL